jgi:hypothetical protein
MQLNGTPTLEQPAVAGTETAPYSLNYCEVMVALYASDVPTGTRLADLSATVAPVVASLGLAEVATRAKRLQCADLASGTRRNRDAYDGHDFARLKWARLEGFRPLCSTAAPTVPVPLAFYDDVAALWGWRSTVVTLMADPTCNHRRAAAAIRAEVPTDKIESARARGLALAARAETLDGTSLEALGRWATMRTALACGHPLLSATPDGTAR